MLQLRHLWAHGGCRVCLQLTSCSPSGSVRKRKLTTINRVLSSRKLIFVAAFISRMARTAYLLSKLGPGSLFARNEPSHIGAALISGLGYSSPYAGAPIAPTAQQPPLYPILLAGIFRAFGTYTLAAAWAAVIVNVLAGALTAVLVYQVGRRHFSEAVGRLAAWLWVFPWMYTTVAFSVSLTSAYLAALGLGALFLYIPGKPLTGWKWFKLGVYCGFLALLQPALLTVVCIYWIWLAGTKFHLSRLVVGVAGFLLVLTPWTIRNYVAMGRFIPLRDNFGLELWVGNRPGMHGTADFSGDFPDNDPSDYARLGELRFMDEHFDAAKQFIRANPAGFLRRSLLRMEQFWYIPYPIFPWVLVAVFAWLGAALALWRDRNAWMWLAMLAVFPLVYCVTHNFAPYRHPIEPLEILLTAYIFAGAAPGWLRRAWPRKPA